MDISNKTIGTAIHCKTKPAFNMLSQKEFQERAKMILAIMDDVLGKSFGAYGAPTIISQFPYTYVTKDGYRIGSNLQFEFANGEEVDRIIYGMVMDICARLNYTVGDGTTTAVIATNQIYQKLIEIFPQLEEGYSKNTKDIKDEGEANLGRGETTPIMSDWEPPSLQHLQPKDIIEIFTEVKEEIIKHLNEQVTYITSDNLLDTIRNIVSISSNGDQEITDLIVEAYDKIGVPAITCENSDTMSTYLDIVDGYSAKVYLGDRKYINGEGKKCKHKSVDVIVFDHMVREDTYKHIISPLATLIRRFGRHLVCIAPSYDEHLLKTRIRRDLANEWDNRNDMTLILTSCFYSTQPDRKSIEDLVMLANTTLIDRVLENEILDLVSGAESLPIQKVVNINNRGIPGIAVFRSDDEYTIIKDFRTERSDDNYLLSIGYASVFEGSMSKSVFVFDHYHKPTYEKFLEDAKDELDETIRKYAVLGTYTRDIYLAQQRYTALQMKTAKIFVGGDSALSRDMLRDSVEDAVRAAESAYKYGYILGCNVTTINIIRNMVINLYHTSGGGDRTSWKIKILRALDDGFSQVYLRVLGNSKKMTPSQMNSVVCESVATHMVYDLTKDEYSDTVINSVQTDIEVLTAVLDLLKLIITGNQLLVVGYSHEDTESLTE